MTILQRHGYSAAVFTQTTDVEGEINGFFTYDRQVLYFWPGSLEDYQQRLCSSGEKQRSR